MPHFFAISWVHRDDYLRGGFKMLSWNDTDGTRTAQQILLYTLLLLPAGAALFFLGETGYLYLLISGLAALIFIYLAVKFYRDPELAAARKVFHFSIIYLPMLFMAIILDRFIETF
jgi:heme O synthase-like polyprenyltransferase